jgi:hypothetical protein
MATKYLDDSTWQYEIGLNIGLMARCLGAQAPVLDIAKQFIDDCTVGFYFDKQDYYIYARFGSKESRKQCMDLNDPRLREDGIYTAIVEWWLCDETFMQKYDQYIEWISALEACMEHDYISFYECMCDGMYTDPLRGIASSKKSKQNTNVRTQILNVLQSSWACNEKASMVLSNHV